jgi:glycosyltransferase involved in cell wall biosynthesis
MKVVHISTSDVRGGAARAACRLHQGLRRLGVRSRMLVRQKWSDDANIHACGPVNAVSDRVRRLCHPWMTLAKLRIARRLAPGSDLFSTERSEMKTLPLRSLGQPDVVNLHWIPEFIDLPSCLAGMCAAAPVVWTLHDMNPFTGGCHYDEGCGRYRTDCGCCPQLNNRKPRDASRRIWLSKEAVYRQINPGRLHLATPSRWLNELAAQSSLLGRFPSSVVPNGLDTDVFCPGDRAKARASLGVPQTARVLLFLADSVQVKRKGFLELLAALEVLRDVPELLLLSVGRSCPQPPHGLRHLHMGSIEDDAQLCMTYNAADVFVIPSLQDNLPNTVLEAMACGTPVTGFDAGGIPDMVRPGVTGTLVPAGDTEALARAIQELLVDGTLCRHMGQAARRIALEEYTLERQARKYSDLYHELLAPYVAGT